jgi:hypothetical protein
MADIPRPNYDYDVNKLVKAYENAVLKIAKELERIDLIDFSRAHSIAVLSEVSKVLIELDETTIDWVEKVVPMAIIEGATTAILALEVVTSIEDAEKIVKFNKFNKELVKVMIADTQTDLLAISQNVDRRVRNAVRQVFAETVRNNYAAGINGRKTINQQTIDGLKKKLGDAVNIGIIDNAGRRWKPQDYVDMLTRTKLMYAYNEAHTNEAISRGAFYGVISSHGATDACRYHEGRIVKLSEEAEGDFPTIEQLRGSGQIFHHRCKHHVSSFRSIELLPQPVREKATRQAEIGNKALSTGKRNPELSTN